MASGWLAGPKSQGFFRNVKEMAQNLDVPEEFVRRFVATLIALYLLETKFKEWENEWHLSADKAERWLEVMRVFLDNPEQTFREWLTQVTGDNKITRVNALVVSPPHNHKG